MKECEKHDGISPIIVTETEEGAQFQQLWSYLVPPSGRARTAQGEIIRIAGRIRHEIMGNGCLNWDEDFRKMLRAFPEYVKLGNAFDEEGIENAKLLTELIVKSADKNCCNEQLCMVLCSCAVAWVRQNPSVIEPLDADYNR